MIVLDTNVLSELMRPTPDTGVIAWVANRPGASLFTTTITQAEIMYELRLLPAGRRRDALDAITRTIFDVDFSGRVLSFDRDAAHAYANIVASRRLAGRPVTQADAMIASIAHSRGARVATRNVRDFADCGIDVVDPWSA